MNIFYQNWIISGGIFWVLRNNLKNIKYKTLILGSLMEATNQDRGKRGLIQWELLAL